MIRNTSFGRTRFINLCHKEMIESWKSNLLRVALVYGAMVAITIWNGYLNYRASRDSDITWSLNLIISIWGLWMFDCLSASFTTERTKSKTGRLSIFMAPATSFERFPSHWLIFTVVFLIVFLVTYKLTDYTKVLVYSLAYPENDTIAVIPLFHLFGDNIGCCTVFRRTYMFILMIVGYFFFQSRSVLGSTVWPKNSFVKTLSAGVIVFIVYVLIVGGFAKLMWPDRMSFSPGISEEAAFGCPSVIATLSTLVSWTLSYLRFKESEIINRM